MIPPLDPLLLSYVEAADAEADDRLTTLLSDHAEEWTRQVLRRTLGPRDRALDDLTSDVLLALVERLRQMRCDESPPIASFEAYVRTTASRAVSGELRLRHPRRYRLENKLRYLLESRSQLRMWQQPGEGVLCGLSGSRDSQSPAISAGQLERVSGEPPHRLTKETRRIRDVPSNAVAWVTWILERSGAPVRLFDLTARLAELWQLREDRRQEPDEEGLDPLDRLPSREPAPDSHAVLRQMLRRVWREVLELRPPQRMALLFNLRDPSGGGILALFPTTGVTSLREIARSLELSESELAELWPRLPMEDRELGERLGLSRQQVINLRKAARARLGRRLGSLIDLEAIG